MFFRATELNWVEQYTLSQEVMFQLQTVHFWIILQSVHRTNGGVIFSFTSDIVATGCTFLSNSIMGINTQTFGGANVSIVSNVAIKLSIFVNNTALYGGAVHCRHCDVTLYETSFVANAAPHNGRTVFIADCHYVNTIKSEHIENAALGNGGVLWIESSYMFIYNCNTVSLVRYLLC